MGIDKSGKQSKSTQVMEFGRRKVGSWIDFCQSFDSAVMHDKISGVVEIRVLNGHGIQHESLEDPSNIASRRHGAVLVQIRSSAECRSRIRRCGPTRQHRRYLRMSQRQATRCPPETALRTRSRERSEPESR